MRTAYGIDKVPYQGEGQTIVLVDSFGSPTAAHDLDFFARTFNLPKPASRRWSPTASPGISMVASGNLHSNQVSDLAAGQLLSLDAVTGYETTAGYDLTTG
jgi:subtilase family serine protease